MLIDLHAHYPMHLVPQNEGTAIERFSAGATLCGERVS